MSSDSTTAIRLSAADYLFHRQEAIRLRVLAKTATTAAVKARLLQKAEEPCYAAGMSLGLPIVLAAALIAAGIAISHRYAIDAHACAANNGNCSRVWRVDEWTGRMLFCEYRPGNIESTVPACWEPKTITPPTD